MEVWGERFFSAPSTTFPGATITVTCSRKFDQLDVTETWWGITVEDEQGEPIEHAGNGFEYSSMDEFVCRLASYYDGTTSWTLDGRSQSMPFYEMLVRALPTNMLADAFRVSISPPTAAGRILAIYEAAFAEPKVG